MTELMRIHMQVIDGVRYIQVHPTFFYESLWCCVLLIILILYRKHKKYDGELFLLYMFGYGLGRVWIEGLRTDQLIIPGTGIAVSQLLAGVLVIGMGILPGIFPEEISKTKERVSCQRCGSGCGSCRKSH